MIFAREIFPRLVGAYAFGHFALGLLGAAL